MLSILVSSTGTVLSLARLVLGTELAALLRGVHASGLDSSRQSCILNETSMLSRTDTPAILHIAVYYQNGATSSFCASVT